MHFLLNINALLTLNSLNTLKLTQYLRTPLFMAAEDGRTAVMEVLLRNNADPKICKYVSNY